MKCPECGQLHIEYKFTYVCPRSHEWEERVGAAEDKGLTEEHPRTFVMPFGKHKGEDIADLPTEYLRWMCENLDDKPELQREAENQLALRSGKGVAR